MLIDKFSNTIWAENFASKGMVEEFLEFFVNMIDRKKGHISTFQFFVSDQGGELMSTEFKNFLRQRNSAYDCGTSKLNNWGDGRSHEKVCNDD